MKKKNKIFWFEGLSGSGKTTLANKIKNDIEEFLGPTIVINGDNIRSIFELKDYSINARKKIAKNYLKLAIFVSKQKINVIFTVVGLHGYLDKLIHSNPNIIRVLIKSNVNDIIKFGKKNTYKKNKKNIVGVDIKPIWPLKPNVIINNNFKKNTDILAQILKKKIFKILKC